MPKSGKEHVTCPTQGPWGRGRENAKVNSVIDVAELTGCLKAYLYHKTGHCLKGCCLLVFFVDFVFFFFFFISGRDGGQGRNHCSKWEWEGHQEAEGHENQSRAFEEGDTSALILMSFQLRKTEAKEGRSESMERPFPNSQYLHLCCDYRNLGALRGSWPY